MRQIVTLIILLASCAAFSSENIWLEVDTKALKLSVNRGNKTLEVLENVAIGKRGAGFKRHIGDEITPLGEYRIGWIDYHSAFHLFMGLTYPSLEDAKVAKELGLISQKHLNAIAAAEDWGNIPPQNTPLGGRIGIHGLGRADPKIHAAMNWTRGCIALTNAQIDRLSRWGGSGNSDKNKIILEKFIKTGIIVGG